MQAKNNINTTAKRTTQHHAQRQREHSKEQKKNALSVQQVEMQKNPH